MNRRSWLRTAAGILVAPAIVRAESIMRVRPVVGLPAAVAGLPYATTIAGVEGGSSLLYTILSGPPGSRVSEVGRLTVPVGATSARIVLRARNTAKVGDVVHVLLQAEG